MRSKILVSLLCAVVSVWAVSGLAAAAANAAATLNGAGSTLVAPIEAEWAAAWDNKTGNTVTYQPVGSGTGIKDITARTVVFGASDGPMTDAN